MCGLFGVFGKFSVSMTQEKVFDDMLKAGTVRGEDGTGIFYIKNDKKMAADYLKIGADPFTLMRCKEYSPFINRAMKTKIVVGHHRAATKGLVNTENAHPFKNNHITLVHNGTLKSGIDMTKFKVDSDGLCALIAEKGAKEAFESVVGAYAAIWWDEKQKNLFFLKNDERPLHIWTYKMDSYFASEPNMLGWLMSRHIPGLKFEEVQQHKIEENYIYSLNAESIPVKGEFVAKKQPPATYHYGTVWNTGTTHVTPSVGYSTKHSKAPADYGDLDAEFMFLTEEQIKDKYQQTLWQYTGITDKFEAVFLNTYDKLPANALDQYWFGELVPGVRVVHGIKGSAPGIQYYQIKEGSLIPIVEVSAEEKDKEEKEKEDNEKVISATLPKVNHVKVETKAVENDPLVMTKDNYAVTIDKAEFLASQGCNTCSTILEVEDIPKCLSITTKENRVVGLFCAKCSAEYLKTTKSKV